MWSVGTCGGASSAGASWSAAWRSKRWGQCSSSRCPENGQRPCQTTDWTRHSPFIGQFAFTRQLHFDALLALSGAEGWLSILVLLCCLMTAAIFSITAILSCSYGPHEKSWKIGFGPLDLKSRPGPHCWVPRNSRESTNFLFGLVEGSFPGQRTTTKAPSLHTNCNWLRPQGLKVRPQGLQAFLPNFST